MCNQTNLTFIQKLTLYDKHTHKFASWQNLEGLLLNFWEVLRCNDYDSDSPDDSWEMIDEVDEDTANEHMGTCVTS